VTAGGGPSARSEFPRVVAYDECAVAARAGAEPSLPPAEREPGVVLFVGEDHEDLTSVLPLPVVGALDLGCDTPAAGLAAVPAAALLLRVSTATALRLDIAGPFTAAIGDRCPAARGIASGLHLAIQEAVGNAVMHGNLELDGALRATPGGWRLFAETMHERSQDPALTRRAITLSANWDVQSVEVTVEDLGPGFDPAVPHPAGVASGRGLGLIHGACSAVGFAVQGRRIEMRFVLA